MDNIITLTDEQGRAVQFELLDMVTFNNCEYLILFPVGEKDGEVMILLVEDTNDELESYVSVEDEDILMKVYEIFKNRWKSEYDFADE